MSTTLSTIVTSMETLRKSEKKVAQCVLQNPEGVITATITDFAELTGTSEPTVIRFCRKLGLSGYMELKLNLARELPAGSSIVEDIKLNDQLPEISDKIFNSVKEAIDVAASTVNRENLQKAIDLLLAADTILFLGSGSSGIVAMDAQQKFFRLGIHCNVYVDPHAQVIAASLLSPRDVVIAVSHTGSTKDLLESVTIAKEAGASIIGVTGREKTPLSRICTVSLSVNSKEVAVKLMPLASRFGMLAILDILFVSVAIRGQRTIENLNRGKQSLKNKKY